MIDARASLDQKLTTFILGTAAVLIGGLVGIVGGAIPVLFFFAAALGPVIFVNYRVGVWLLVFLLPFASTQLIPRDVLGVTGLNPVNGLLVLTLLSLFANLLDGRTRIQFVRLPRPLLAYVAVIAFAAYVGTGSAERAVIIPDSVTGAWEPATVTRYLLDNFAKPMVILIVAWLAATVARNGNARPLIWALAVAYVVFFLVIVVYIVINGVSAEYLASPEAMTSGARGFLSWTGMHANEIGLQANLGFAVLLYTAVATRHTPSRVILFACASAAGVMAALTFSRGAFLGIVVILGYYLLTRRRLGQFLLVLVLVLGTSLMFPDDALVERATTGFQTGDTYAITAGRVQDIWRPLIGTFWQAPIIGHGLSSTLWATPNLRGEMLPVGHPHSAYLGVLLDLGLVGVAVVGVFFWSAWRMFRGLSRDHVDAQWRGLFEGGVVALLCLAIQGLTDDRFVPTYSQAALWVCYGLALGHTQLMLAKERYSAVARASELSSPLCAACSPLRPS